MKNQLQNILHNEIPLTRHIGISVKACTTTSVILHAPLENNINHKCTAFGGSLYSVSVLSGWGLVYLLLERHSLAGHIVIQDSSTKFIRPVDTEINATCSFDSETQAEKFIAMYKRKGMARIKLNAEISCNNQPAVIFTGSYVVHQ